MPGHMLSARCPCGFSGFVNPGVTERGVLFVIAYTEDGSALTTVEEKEGLARGREIIRDPFLSAAMSLGEAPAYRCPKCEKVTMQFSLAGLWD